MNLISIVELSGIAIAVILLVLLLFKRQSASPISDSGLVLDRLQTIKADVDRLDRMVREDGENARTGADERGRLLREEIVKSLTDSRAEMSQAMANDRAESAAASLQLRDGIQLTLIKMGDSLRTGAKDAAEQQRLVLETMVEKVANLSETNAKAADKLRESLQENLTALRTENSEKLELIRLA